MSWSRGRGRSTSISGDDARRACCESTSTRSARKIASSMSWVTKRTVCQPLGHRSQQHQLAASSRVWASTRRERLVHEQHPRVGGDQRRAIADPLLHPAGQLPGVVRPSNVRRGGRRPRASRDALVGARGAAGRFSREARRSVATRQPGEEAAVVLLEDDLTAVGAPLRPGAVDGGSRRRLGLAGGRRWCAAAWSCRSRTGRRGQTNSPSAIDNETFSIASVSPLPTAKALRIPFDLDELIGHAAHLQVGRCASLSTRCSTYRNRTLNAQPIKPISRTPP